MDLKEFGQQLAKIGLPLLGAALPIPGGSAIGAALASAIGSKSAEPVDVVAALTGNPEAAQKAREFELAHQSRLMEMAYANEVAMRQADSADIGTVNETMRAELANSANEAWYQKAWRPANGFAVAAGSFLATLFCCYLFYAALNTPRGEGMTVAEVINVIPSLASAIALILGVPGAAVGIAAWHRGKEKRGV